MQEVQEPLFIDRWSLNVSISIHFSCIYFLKN